MTACRKFIERCSLHRHCECEKVDISADVTESWRCDPIPTPSLVDVELRDTALPNPFPTRWHCPNLALLSAPDDINNAYIHRKLDHAASKMPSNPGGDDVEVGGDVADTSDYNAGRARGRGGGGGSGVDGGSSLGLATSSGSYQPLISIIPSPTGRRRGSYNPGVGRLTGLLQILCGSVTAVMGLLTMVLHSHHYFMDLPLWAGLLFLFCGVFGVSTMMEQTFMIGLYLLFSTISCMMSSVIIVTEGHATFMEANGCDCSIFQNTSMLYNVTAALVSCMELLVAAVAVYHCMAGLGCCGCCWDDTRQRESMTGLSQPPILQDYSHIPLPPAPVYPVLSPPPSYPVLPPPPCQGNIPDKVPLESPWRAPPSWKEGGHSNFKVQ